MYSGNCVHTNKFTKLCYCNLTTYCTICEQNYNTRLQGRAATCLLPKSKTFLSNCSRKKMYKMFPKGRHPKGFQPYLLHESMGWSSWLFYDVISIVYSNLLFPSAQYKWHLLVGHIFLMHILIRNLLVLLNLLFIMLYDCVLVVGVDHVIVEM